MTWTVSTTPVSISARALAGWWSLIETPKKRILPSAFSASTASSQSPWPTQRSFQTCSCWTSIASTSRLERLRSVQRRTHSPGNASSAVASSGAGQRWFLGGTFVATYTRSSRSATTWPTSCSLWPRP